MSPELAPGRVVGKFVLVESLGEGGNAFVWRARRDELGEVALKILKTKRVQSEPYARFRREVDTLQRIGPMAGVLPLLDANIPAQPRAADRAWLAMPVAEPVVQALAEASTERLVEAGASLAETLAGLLEEHGLSRRDLKPSNLYWYQGGAVIGDFGLVSLPDTRELTRRDKPLGPTNFMPYEMLVDPATADPAAADVYSFAKSFWVMLSGQRFHQVANNLRKTLP